MDQWSKRPDRGEVTHSTKLVRAKPGKAIGGICLSADVIGAYTHYWQGRTRICEGPGCEACESNRAARWYGFLAIAHEQSKEVAILEITASSLQPIEAHLKKYGTLRGARISLKRAGAKINSRILATIEPTVLRDNELPTTPDVEKILAKMWEVKEPQESRPAPKPRLNGEAKSERIRT